MQSAPGGGIDLVLLRVAPGGGSLVYATRFGGSGHEFTETHGLWVDEDGTATIAATTLSADLPFAPAVIPPPFQPLYGGTGGPGAGSGTNYPGDGFVARVSPDGRHLRAFTYLGGAAGEGLEGCALDRDGHVLVSGATYSADFPVTPDGPQPVHGGGADSFVVRLRPDLSAIDYGTFLGGAGDDLARCLAFGAVRVVACAGMTASFDWPATPGAGDTSYGGAFDGFVFELD